MTIARSGDCAPDLCPVHRGFLSDSPSMEGSLVMLAAFAFLIPVNLMTGLRWKTPTYTASLITGLLFEVMGYVGRFMLRTNLASRRYFVMFLLGTIMGPTFITAAIYLVLPHILAIYGSDVNVVSQPIFLAYFFFALDIFTLAFQAVGGTFAVQGTSRIEVNQGTNVLLVGLALQILSISVFLGLYYWFLLKLAHNHRFLDQEHSSIYRSARFKTSIFCLQIAIILILIRTATRLVQISTGFDSAISQSQVYIIVLDGAEVLLACAILSALPPGAAFRSAWAATSPYHPQPAREHGGYAYSLQPQRSPGFVLSPPPQPPAPPSKFGSQQPLSPAQSMHSSGGGSRKQQQSPRWALYHHQHQHRRQPSAPRIEGQPPPPYDRPITFQRVPYQPSPGRYTPGLESESTVSSPIEGPTRPRRVSRPTADTLVEHDAVW